MLTQMREGKFVKNVFIIVIVTFVLSMVFVWGADYSGTGCGTSAPRGQQWVGMVGDVGISLAEYDDFYRRNLSQLTRGRQAGQSVYDDEILRLQDQVFESMVAKSIIDQEAARIGLVISDEEVLNVLTHDPPDFLKYQFMDEAGNFDWDTYNQALNNPNIDWKRFEDIIRDELPGERLQQLNSTNIHIGEGDIVGEFERRFGLAQVAYVSQPWRDITLENEEPGDDVLRAWMAENADQFEQAERYTIQAVKLSRDPSAADEDYVRQRMEYIKGEITGGKAFEDLARDFSQDMANAESGGDLGWIGRTGMDPLFTEAAFALGDGEISEPIRSDFGYHLIKTEEHRTDGPTEEVRVRHILMRVELSYATQDSLSSLTDSLRIAALDSDLATATTQFDCELLSPAPFAEREAIEGLGYNSAVKARVAKMKVGDVSFNISSRDANYIVQLLAIEEAGPGNFDDLRDRVLTGWKRDQQLKQAREKIEQVLRVRTRDKLSLKAAAENLGYELKETPEFVRADYLPGIGGESAFQNVAHMLNTGEVSGVIETSQGFFALEVLTKTPSDKSIFQNEHDKILEELRNAAQQVYLASWLTEMKEKYEVEDFRDQYYYDYSRR
ncbi:MAG: hypothetical protein GY835_21040 [bacterium]|nr:hypothetical protein [bacterium]